MGAWLQFYRFSSLLYGREHVSRENGRKQTWCWRAGATSWSVGPERDNGLSVGFEISQFTLSGTLPLMRAYLLILLILSKSLNPKWLSIQIYESREAILIETNTVPKHVRRQLSQLSLSLACHSLGSCGRKASTEEFPRTACPLGMSVRYCLDFYWSRRAQASVVSTMLRQMILHSIRQLPNYKSVSSLDTEIVNHIFFSNHFCRNISSCSQWWIVNWNFRSSKLSHSQLLLI